MIFDADMPPMRLTASGRFQTVTAAAIDRLWSLGKALKRTLKPRGAALVLWAANGNQRRDSGRYDRPAWSLIGQGRTSNTVARGVAPLSQLL